MAITPRRELLAFAATLGVLVCGFFGESLLGGRILSPADVLFASESFRNVHGPAYEPANRLLIDPVLQFQPWIEFNRRMIRSGRLPLWNPMAGCGAPHLANGQSAVFDPFQLIAYLGDLSSALGRMAAARLWFAGLGMFLLARAWEYGAWGRWFTGLTFPFCGFLVGWLLYPVTNVAIWMPWVFLATERLFHRPSAARVGGLALAVGGTLLGGHVQTSAHVLLAVGAYACWRAWTSPEGIRKLSFWSLGIFLGVGISAIEVVPLGYYLSKSPVWSDRERERTTPWAIAKPRVLDSACTALPYLYGSQRRGQPNLARALGVNNLNESAGGFAGLATFLWLAPLAWSSRRAQSRVGFLTAILAFGWLGAFRFPPVDNLLRALPVLGVTDNRRLTLWVAFSLVSLGGIGLDRLSTVRGARGWSTWVRIWVIASIAFLAAAACMGQFAPMIRARAVEHYSKAAEATPGAEDGVYRSRAERQVRETLDFVPRYLGLAAAQGLTMAWIFWAVRRGRIGDNAARASLLGLTLVDLFGFGIGLNPTIDRADNRPETPVLAAIRREVGRTGRIIGLGAELPPNTLMRYGLADARNYDSVEVSRSLDWFGPLYDPSVEARTSRRDITWTRVIEAQDRLREASVRAVVGPTPPPHGFGRSEKIGDVWVAWLDAKPLIQLDGEGLLLVESDEPGRLITTVESDDGVSILVRQTFDPGWRAEVDGKPVRISEHFGVFMTSKVPPGRHRVAFYYDPEEVRIGWMVSSIALIMAVFALTDFGRIRFTRYSSNAALDGPKPSG